MKTYTITLEVDEQWLEAIRNFTNDIYDGELCRWLSLEESSRIVRVASDGSLFLGDD